MYYRWERIILLLLIPAYAIQYSYSQFVIEQCPGADVATIRRQIEFNEISLTFYYTQWSKESLKAKQHFNEVAEYFGDKIYFAAIDCWHLACNCSKALPTAIGSGSPHKWPTLIVHYGRSGQFNIQYNGLYNFRDIVHFVMNVLYPIERIETREDLEEMRYLTDGVILGAFKNINAIQYKQYFMAAIKWLEYDPTRKYRFAVRFGKENYKTDAIESNLFLLGHKTNKTFVDYSNFKWNTSNILHWLREELNNEIITLRTFGTPVAIAEKIKKEPVLAVFVNERQQFFSYMEKYVDHRKPFTQAKLNCENIKARKTFMKDWKFSLRNFLAVPNLVVLKNNSVCYCHKDFILKNLKHYYEINHYFQLYHTNRNMEVYELLSFFQSTVCLQREDIASQSSLHIGIVKILEDFCRNEQHCANSNRSLSVVLLDGQRYKDYLENLDITPMYESIATAFIVDNEKENIHVMEDRFAMLNLVEFIKKFYSNALNNYYQNRISLSRTQLPLSSPLLRDTDIEIKQLNRYIFLNYLQHMHNQTLVVLMYSPECALCGNIQHSFLQLSLSLRNIMDLKFVRINTMSNDLPCQFNMPFLPALLVFPENRFSESRIFPTYLKPDIQNVFGFILSQLPAHQQIRVVLDMCKSGTLSKRHAQSCWQFAKTILMQHIGKHLQYWQMFEAERILIFDRLRAFQDMSIDIHRNLRL